MGFVSGKPYLIPSTGKLTMCSWSLVHDLTSPRLSKMDVLGLECESYVAVSVCYILLYMYLLVLLYFFFWEKWVGILIEPKDITYNSEENNHSLTITNIYTLVQIWIVMHAQIYANTDSYIHTKKLHVCVSYLQKPFTYPFVSISRH